MTGPDNTDSSAKTADADDPTLTARVAKGTAFIVATRFILRSLGIINTLILARILTPADFGLVALGITVMQLLQNVSDIGVSQTVIRFRDAGERQLNTLFTLSLIRGLGVMTLLIIAAPIAGAIYDDPRIIWIFLGISVVPLMQSLINPRFYEFERSLDFSKEMLASGANKLIAVAVSVAVALTFRTYWAIVLGLASGVATQMIISYIVRPFRPRLSLASFKELIGFTGWLTGVSFVVALNNKLDVLILGRVVGAGPTGAYYVGDQLASLPTVEIAEPVARAVYPGLSELQSDTGQMNRAFLRGVEVLGAVALPAAVGCAFIARDFVHLLLGAQWDAAIPVVQAFAPVAGIMCVFFLVHFYALALGRTRPVFFRELAVFLIRTPLFIWAALTHGFMGAIYAAAATELMRALFNLWLYQHISGRPFWEPVARISRSLVSCGSMAVFFFYIRPLIPAIEAAPLLIRIVEDVVIAAAFYSAMHVALWIAAGKPAGFETTMIELAQRFRKKAG